MLPSTIVARCDGGERLARVEVDPGDVPRRRPREDAAVRVERDAVGARNRAVRKELPKAGVLARGRITAPVEVFVV